MINSGENRQIMNLDEGKVGVFYRVVEIEGEVSVVRRLCDLGFWGERVKIERRSGLGGVCLVEVRGVLLSLRSGVLKNIKVKV